ncbi:hypothetical protein GGR50DRAFT_167688 [Xylaria sp. CBS 124048]|nr:hypothetical protein GGR50DRAFT_167688 [Xylaria sp. CBS 124048]
MSAPLNRNDKYKTTTIHQSTRTCATVDNTEELSHTPHELTLFDFHNALGLCVDLRNISRAAYYHLIQTFQLVKDIDSLRTFSPRKDVEITRVQAFSIRQVTTMRCLQVGL